MSQEEPSIADDIRSSMEESVEESTETTETPSEPPLSKETSARERDGAGRFVAQAAKAVQDGAPTTPDNTAQSPETAPEQLVAGPVKLTTEKPPSSWVPSAREMWKDIPDAVKSEIIRREQDSANQHHRFQEQFAPVQGLVNQINPYLQEAQSLGVDGIQFIHNTMSAERTLRTAAMPEKFQALLSIADQYGIPLRQIVNESVGQQVLATPTPGAALPPEIAQEFEAIKQWRSEQEYGQVLSQVEAWGANKEFFNDVRETMGKLVEAQMANNIDEAYEMACRMHPDVSKVMSQRSGQAQSQTSVVSRQVAAAGVAKAGGARATPKDEKPDADKSLHDEITEAFYANTSGRV